MITCQYSAIFSINLGNSVMSCCSLCIILFELLRFLFCDEQEKAVNAEMSEFVDLITNHIEKLVENNVFFSFFGRKHLRAVFF